MTPEKENNSLVLKNATRADGNIYDITVENGKITSMDRAKTKPVKEGFPVFDASGTIVFSSFIDAHVHLREPGYEYKEDIESGLTAAKYGGFGHVLAMANTKPVNDSAAITSAMLHKAKSLFPNGPYLHPVGALSVGLKGKELAPMGELVSAGVVAISNDGVPVSNNDLFCQAMRYAHTWGLKIIDHCEDADIASNWLMHEGPTSTKLGLKGQPSVGESLQVARDVLLAEYLDLPIHLAHISSAQSVDVIRWAKARGVKVTAETCPHYVFLNDEMIGNYSTSYKVSPPIRSTEDMLALRKAVADGTIDIFVTDHAPHAQHEKEVPFDEAPKGLIGLETALSLTWQLVESKELSLKELEDLWCHKPAEIFNLKVNEFKVGDQADFFLFDPNVEWTVNRDTIHSKSLNTPWLNQVMKGKVISHWMNGYKII